MKGVRIRAGVAGLAVAGLCAAVALPAGAALRTPSERPLGLGSVSLRQDGPDLVWSVRASGPFSPRALARHGKSLCLSLAQPARRGTVAGELCLIGPAPGGGSPRLAFRAGGAHSTSTLVPALVSRADTRSFTASFTATAVGLRYRDLRFQVWSTAAAPGCAPSTACALASPAVPSLLRMHDPIPVGCVAAGPSWVASGSGERREVALTFDDGPWSDTPWFLDLLEREHVVATFFQVGEHLSEYGGPVERRMLADGDVIGDHTWSHLDVAGGGALALTQLSLTRAAIERATGFTPCLFRAPYGAVSPALIRIARSLGMLTIQWNVDPRDWARPGTATIVSTVLDTVRPGSIVLQHDGGGDRSQTLAALSREITTLRARGYTFVTVPQLLGLRMRYR